MTNVYFYLRKENDGEKKSEEITRDLNACKRTSESAEHNGKKLRLD